MSWNHENVAWQSKDKTWNIGFFPSNFYGNEAEGDDPEWDVTYDYDRFQQVFTGHKTVEAAQVAASRTYGNYGGARIVERTKDNMEYINQYEEMALWHTNPEQAKLNEKKKLAKLNREHAAKLKEQLVEHNDYRGCNVTVIIKKDDNVYTRMGVTTSVTGYLTQEGDWLVVEKVKVKNVKTGRLNSKLHEIRAERVFRGGYTGGWYR